MAEINWGPKQPKHHLYVLYNKDDRDVCCWDAATIPMTPDQFREQADQKIPEGAPYTIVEMVPLQSLADANTRGAEFHAREVMHVHESYKKDFVAMAEELKAATQDRDFHQREHTRLDGLRAQLVEQRDEARDRIHELEAERDEWRKRATESATMRERMLEADRDEWERRAKIAMATLAVIKGLPVVFRRMSNGDVPEPRKEALRQAAFLIQEILDNPPEVPNEPNRKVPV